MTTVWLKNIFQSNYAEGLHFSAFHYHIGEPSIIPKLLLPCVNDIYYDYAVFFVRRYYALFSKYGVSVRTHVHEGICIPLVVKHELSRHITTSRGRST